MARKPRNVEKLAQPPIGCEIVADNESTAILITIGGGDPSEEVSPLEIEVAAAVHTEDPDPDVELGRHARKAESLGGKARAAMIKKAHGYLQKCANEIMRCDQTLKKDQVAERIWEWAKDAYREDDNIPDKIAKYLGKRFPDSDKDKEISSICRIINTSKTAY